jgi:hypothetical protein
MRLAEKTTAVCEDEAKEESSVSEVSTTETKTFEVPGWVQVVQSFTQGLGLCIGVILALPFIAVSRGIEWYQNNKNKVEK